MKTKFLKISAILVCVMTMMASCDNTSIEPETPEPEPTPEWKEPLVMTFQDFITTGDVQILSSDTTSISVSKAYVDKMGITDFNDRAVTIWRTIGTIPFIRIIKDSKVENDKVILTTVRGEFADMFENLEMSLETSLYVNRDFQPSVATRTGTNYEVDDVSGKYVDTTGVYHPAVIIFEEDSPAARTPQTRSGETKNYFTAEELLEDNLAFDIIDFHTDVTLDFAYPKNDSLHSKDDARLHVKGKLGIQSKLSAYANVNISWFSLKEFETGVTGSSQLTAKLGIGVEKKIEQEWEQTYLTLGQVTTVFWVGFVPVPFTIKSDVKGKVEASATASAMVYASAKYKIGFEKGCRYTPSNGWEDTSKETKTEKTFSFDGVKGSVELEAGTGVFLELKLLLAGSAGPTMAVGPKLSAGVEASATLDEEKFVVDVHAGAYAGLSGEIGAKVEFLGYTLAKWSTGFDLFKYTLFEGGFTYTQSYEGWEKFEKDWTTIVNQGSDEWTWGEETPKSVVPYRLPNSEINF